MTDDTLPEITRQIFWLVVNFILITTIALLISLESQIQSFYDLNNIALAKNIWIIGGTVLTSGIASFFLYMLQVDRKMEQVKQIRQLAFQLNFDINSNQLVITENYIIR